MPTVKEIIIFVLASAVLIPVYVGIVMYVSAVLPYPKERKK